MPRTRMRAGKGTLAPSRHRLSIQQPEHRTDLGWPPSRRRTESTTTRLDLTVAGPRVGAVRTSERAGHRSVAASVDLPGIEVELSVLGTVEVHGAARKFTRAWALELVVYLAMHPGGASNEAWATALWPDRLMAPSSLHSTVSVARRALGSARDGSDHLPRSHGRLALASTVGTDWARFQKLAESDDPDRWEAALTVVRGRPFDGIRATDWSLLDGTAPSIEAAVVDLSGRLAGARLRSGDPYGAEWAARKGLLVSPYDERLYRMLLRTADAAGNPEGVETVMAELVRVVADEVEPVESVHPSTLALYRALSRRSRPVVEASPRMSRVGWVGTIPTVVSGQPCWPPTHGARRLRQILVLLRARWDLPSRSSTRRNSFSRALPLCQAVNSGVVVTR